MRGIGESLSDEERRDVFGPGIDVRAPRPADVLPGVLERLAHRRPVAMLVEDARTLGRPVDPGSHPLLRRRAGHSTASHRGTYRRDDPEVGRRHPLRVLLAELERLERVTHIRLQGFGPADQLEQLRGILGQEPGGELLRSVIERSDGNPFLTEVLAANAGRADLSPGLRALLHSRVAQLDDRAQAVVRMAAVGGRQIDHRLLAEVAGLPPADLNTGLRAAVDHHVIVTRSDSYEFRHAPLA